MVVSTHISHAIGERLLDGARLLDVDPLVDVDRLRDVVGHLPPGPFSLGDFVNHAIGLNALDNHRDVEPFLQRLVSEGLIYRLGKNIAMWVVVTDETCRRSPTI